MRNGASKLLYSLDSASGLNTQFGQFALAFGDSPLERRNPLFIDGLLVHIADGLMLEALQFFPRDLDARLGIRFLLGYLVVLLFAYTIDNSFPVTGFSCGASQPHPPSIPVENQDGFA